MDIKPRGTSLLADLIREGRIPGIGVEQIRAAAIQQRITGQPAPVKLPVVFCERCPRQLTTHWYACNPVLALQLICDRCAMFAERDGDTVHVLVEG